MTDKEKAKKLAAGIAKEIKNNKKTNIEPCAYSHGCGPMGDSHEGYECGHASASDKFQCDGAGPMAFGCQGHYKCQSDFGCDGGITDDFECYNGSGFDCKKDFDCSYSFDEEDCESKFECDNKSKFNCSTWSYKI